jgi:CDP-diacylglycerol--glycerol-3-phosphate 3-phosphatidyltransferase
MNNIPNILTLSRIALIPVFIACYYWPYLHAPLVSAAIFGLAAFTDWLDGYLARRLNMVSPFGAFLDPVADKLMVVTVLVVLLQANPDLALALPVAVIIGREITVSALREWMAELGTRKAVKVSVLGKWKTALQMLSIMMLLAGGSSFLPQWIWPLGLGFLYIASIMTFWSMVLYLKAAWPLLDW